MNEEKPRPRADIMGGPGGAPGVGPGNLSDVFSFHRHDGGPASGGALFGPYFIFDAAGKKRKLSVSATGVATWSLV